MARPIFVVRGNAMREARVPRSRGVETAMELDHQANAVLNEMAAEAKGEPEPTSFDARLAKARRDAANLQRFSAPAPRGVSRIDRRVPFDGGSIPVRLYRPDAQRRPRLLVWFHGGGTIAGSLDTHEPVLMALAARTGRAVASVGYTLAPEAVFPVQHEECLAAARALSQEASALDLDPEGWAIGGDSVGGLYAAATAIAMRDEGFKAPPAAQILLYPNTDLSDARDHPSLAENEGRIMTLASLRFEAETAVPDAADRAGPRASPLFEADLSRLPPALVVTAEADPLRDEGEAYARRMAAAGVAVEHRRVPGMIHAFLQMNARIDAGDEWMGVIGGFLRGIEGVSP